MRFNDMLAEQIWRQSVTGMAFVAADGTWLRVNPALCKLLGYTELELIGDPEVDIRAQRFQDITPDRDTQIDLEMVNRVVRRIEPWYHMIKHFRAKTGETVRVGLTVFPVIDEASGEVNFLFSQVVPHKNATVELQGLSERALVKNKAITVEDISQFLHENWKRFMTIGGVIAAAIFALFKMLKGQ